MGLYLEKFEGDVYLQSFDEPFVRKAAAAFCTMHAKEFKVSELALERGCVLPVFNQLFVQINIRKDELAAKSQQENEEKMERERQEEIANSREVVLYIMTYQDCCETLLIMLIGFLSPIVYHYSERRGQVQNLFQSCHAQTALHRIHVLSAYVVIIV